MKKIEVDILGISNAPTTGGAYALILREINGNRKLPIIIGPYEAQAVVLELEGVKPARPMTHDLLKNFLDHVGVTVQEILIDDIRENTFFAKIIIEYSTLTDAIDSRPSDAIALAVRVRCPIFVSEDVINSAGIVTDGEKESGDEQSTSQGSDAYKNPREIKIATLNNQLREALEKEEYERAAKLRDMIKELEGNN